MAEHSTGQVPKSHSTLLFTLNHFQPPVSEDNGDLRMIFLTYHNFGNPAPPKIH